MKKIKNLQLQIFKNLVAFNENKSVFRQLRPEIGPMPAGAPEVKAKPEPKEQLTPQDAKRMNKYLKWAETKVNEAEKRGIASKSLQNTVEALKKEITRMKAVIKKPGSLTRDEIAWIVEEEILKTVRDAIPYTEKKVEKARIMKLGKTEMYYQHLVKNNEDFYKVYRKVGGLERSVTMTALEFSELNAKKANTKNADKYFANVLLQRIIADKSIYRIHTYFKGERKATIDHSNEMLVAMAETDIRFPSEKEAESEAVVVGTSIEELRDRTEQVEDVSQKYFEDSQRFNKQREDFEKNKNKFETAAAAYNTEEADYKKARASLDDRVKNLKTNQVQLNDQIKDLAKRKPTLTPAQYSKSLAALNKHKEELKKEGEAINKANDVLNKTYANLEKKGVELQNQQAQVSKERERLSNIKGKLDSEVKDLRKLRASVEKDWAVDKRILEKERAGIKAEEKAIAIEEKGAKEALVEGNLSKVEADRIKDDLKRRAEALKKRKQMISTKEGQQKFIAKKQVELRSEDERWRLMGEKPVKGIPGYATVREKPFSSMPNYLYRLKQKESKNLRKGRGKGPGKAPKMMKEGTPMVSKPKEVLTPKARLMEIQKRLAKEGVVYEKNQNDSEIRRFKNNQKFGPNMLVYKVYKGVPKVYRSGYRTETTTKGFVVINKNNPQEVQAHRVIGHKVAKQTAGVKPAIEYRTSIMEVPAEVTSPAKLAFVIRETIKEGKRMRVPSDKEIAKK